MQFRIETIRKILKEQSLDAVLISSHPNILYTTNYSGFYQEERDAYIFITKTSGYIFTHALYAEAMPEAVPHLKLLELTRDFSLNSQLHTLCKKHEIIKLGFENTNITVSEFDSIKSLPVKFIPIDFHTLRLLKQPEELQKIQQACRLTDKAFSYILGGIRAGITEKEIEHKIITYMIQNDAESAFRPIVAFGKNSSVPHHLSGQTKLQRNDVILIDFGAKVDKYVADMTRTFFIGTISDKWKELYTIVLNTQKFIQKEIIRNLQTNLPIISSELDQLAREFITERNYPAFPYSLGHGIGLEVHERPLLNQRYQDIITNTMVFTLEPGIHLTGEIGIRIEDDFTIQNNKLIQLTRSDNELIII